VKRAVNVRIKSGCRISERGDEVETWKLYLTNGNWSGSVKVKQSRYRPGVAQRFPES
jgi:hypothetical protein